MKRYKLIIYAFIGLFAVSACMKDLDVEPSDPKVATSATLYDNPDAWKMVLAKCYAGLAVSGQQGPAGKPDISDIDEGFSTYLRQLWCATELPTDEAVISWNDAGLKDYHNQNWSASNPFITAMYNRIYYQLSLVNEFIRAINDKIGGLSSSLQADVTEYEAEARFLRAYSYWHALDMFGSVPFVTEKDDIGAFMPKQISKADLFSFIESELLDIEDNLAESGANEYGRVDRVSAWMLLAKLYLNAKVYIDTDRYSDCINYCNKILESTYSIDPVYANIFKADNFNSPEIIFTVEFDGNNTRSWGGMTFIVHAQVGGSMSAAAFGLDNGWGGIRTTKALVEKFADPSGATDKRAMFHTDGQSLEIADLSTFTDGYAITKFSNMTSTGTAGSNPTYVDTDFPVFRLADAYLMYAEAVLRGGSGGSITTAVDLVNELRERAYGNNSGNIAEADLTLEFILDERSRELYWEGHRRTDLIRYDYLTTSDYIWPWKGGVANGAAVEDKYNIFPIPSSDIGANTLLTQNTGY